MLDVQTARRKTVFPPTEAVDYSYSTCTAYSRLPFISRNTTRLVIMSKRKIEEVYDQKNGGGTGDAKVPAANDTGGGWADLPAELVRRIGRLQNDAPSLARMERTCKSWQTVIIEGDDAVDMGDNPCLWRELALAEFPRLHTILKLARASSASGNSYTNHSWKALYRTNAEARRLCDSKIDAKHRQQTTSWKDYAIVVEFRRGDELLFVASGRGDDTSPLLSPLWDQDVEFDDDGEVICKGPLNSELSSRLGADPFSQVNMRSITAQVVVTRLSDLSVVELGSATYDYTNDDGDTMLKMWNHNKGGNSYLPIGITKSSGDTPAHVFSEHLRMQFLLSPSNGEVILSFQRWRGNDDGDDFDVGDWEYMTTAEEELLYLETQCPWPSW